MANWLAISELKNRLAVSDPTGTHEDDSLFQTVANEACSWVEQQTGRQFLTTSYTRIFDGEGLPILFMPVTPVTAVSSLIVDTTAVTIGTPDSYRLGTVDSFWANDRITYPAKFPTGYANIKVTWTAGYAQLSIPPRVLGLACTVAILKWRERNRYGDNQKQFPNQTTIYERELKGQDLKTYNELLDWRRLYIAEGVDV